MMVLDEQSAKIISSHFKLSELFEKNILSIEKLELNRKVLFKNHSMPNISILNIIFNF